MDAGDSQCPAVQSADRPNYRSRAHHRDRRGVLSLPPNPRKTQGPNFDGQPYLRCAGGGEKEVAKCRLWWSALVTLIAQGTCCAHLPAPTGESIGRLKSLRNKNHETPGGGPNLSIKVGQTGL